MIAITRQSLYSEHFSTQSGTSKFKEMCFKLIELVLEKPVLWDDYSKVRQ